MRLSKSTHPVLSGVLVLCAVILMFLLVTKCQPDFFRNLSPLL
jgi:hypothetical protein